MAWLEPISHEAYQAKQQQLAQVRHILSQTKLVPNSEFTQQASTALGVEITKDSDALSILRRPEVTAQHISMLLPEIDAAVLAQIEIETKYAGYIKRQDDEIAKIRRHENLLLPEAIDYQQMDGLSNELKQKLTEQQPTSLARAARIPGMTPAALSILLVHAQGYKPAGYKKGTQTRAGNAR